MVWHQLSYESGGTMHVRWLKNVQYAYDGRLLIGTNHIGQEITMSTATPFVVSEKEQLPPRKEEELELWKAGELP